MAVVVDVPLNTCLADLDEALRLVAAELHADRAFYSHYDADGGFVETLSAYGWIPSGERFYVSDYPETARILETKESLQVRVDDPRADRAEVELLLQERVRSALVVPVVVAGRSTGLLEAYSVADRVWRRSEVLRARIVASMLGAILDRVVGRPLSAARATAA